MHQVHPFRIAAEEICINLAEGKGIKSFVKAGCRLMHFFFLG
jgi:hypothetical protein